MNLTFFFDGSSPRFDRVLPYLTVGKVISVQFHYQFEDVGVDRGIFYLLNSLLFLSTSLTAHHPALSLWSRSKNFFYAESSRDW